MILNSNQLSKELYYVIKDTFNLKAQLTANVFRTVTARYKTVQTQLRQRPYHYQDVQGQWRNIQRDLNWLAKPLNFKTPQVDLVRDRDYSFVNDGQQLSLQTLQKGRTTVDFITTGFDQYLKAGWKLGTAKLIHTGQQWFLYASASKELPDLERNDIQHVVGIDRGLNFTATAYDEQGHTTFFNGKAIMAKRRHYLKLLRQLQQKHTKASLKRLRTIASRENRWMTDVNHQIAKTLVNKYGSKTLFVVEDLVNVNFERQNVSKKQRYNLTSWSFFQLEQFLTYKSHLQNSDVVEVDAHYTSQRCPKCGLIDKNNRHHYDEIHHKAHYYHCRNCHYESNDDRIGAMNIQLLGTQWVSGNVRPRIIYSHEDVNE